MLRSCFNYIICFIVAFNPELLIAQNLLPNGGFELYYNCPYTISRTFFAIGCSQPTGGTSDFFNSCAGTNCNSCVPDNEFGYQLARTGNGYAGFYVAGQDGPTDPYREYIQLQFSSKLIKDKKYYFEMYVSLADFYGLATNKIGAFFSPNPYNDSTSLININVTPQIVANQFITNFNKWTKISGSYTALGDESYVIIGDFEPPASNSLKPSPGTSTVFSGEGYYYVDDIGLFDFDCDSILPPGLLNKYTNFCGIPDFKFPLNAYVDSNAGYLWSNGSTDSAIFVTQTGDYWVEISTKKCIFRDTVSIRNSKPTLSLGHDTSICAGTHLILSIPNQVFPNYIWQDGSKSSTLSVDSQGLYWVEITSTDGCKVRDSINIYTTALPFVNLGLDTVLCEGDSLLLNVASIGSQYLWQDNSALPFYKVAAKGKYSVRVTHSYCQATDSIFVDYVAKPKVSLGTDSTLCTIHSLMLDATSSLGDTYLWQNGSTSPKLMADSFGLYWVEVKRSECRVRDSVLFTPFVLPVVDIGRDTTLCEGTVYMISPDKDFKTYFWNDGFLLKNYPARKGGIYWLMITDTNNCSAMDSITLTFKSKPALSLEKVIRICEPDLTIDPGHFKSYQWQDGSTSSTFHITDYGTYSVKVIAANDCSNEDTFEVINDCKPLIFVPNAFSINNDGLNEVFLPVTKNIKALHLEIYNRWGELVFETDQLNFGWDGKTKNGIDANDVFTYLISYEGIHDDIGSISGTVTLLR